MPSYNEAKQRERRKRSHSPLSAPAQTFPLVPPSLWRACRTPSRQAFSFFVTFQTLRCIFQADSLVFPLPPCYTGGKSNAGGKTMIDLANVSKSYQKNGVKALDDLTLHIPGGELFGFIGPNGAGKTTAIKLMCGSLKPDAGKIVMAGHDLAAERLEAQRCIGFVPDGNDLYDRLTGMEYLNFMGDIYQVAKPQRKAHIEKYLSLFSLEDAVGSQIRTYSKGMKQKLMVIGALIHNPPVWILDEPLGGLDPRAAHLLKEEMKNHCAQGNTVFFSTHVLEVAEKLCTRIGVIAHGTLRAVGTLEELRSGETGASLEDVFLEMTGDEGGDAK